MDTLSHAVAGLAATELILRMLPKESGEEQQGLRRRLLLTSGLLASNFPDLDLVLTPLLPEPLGYLMHHRGHTHTLLYALPQALLLGALILLFWSGARRLLQTSATARRGFGLTLIVGFGLHLAMDYLNSYGLHPFHPFNSDWFYGDMVFILEPWFWVSLGVPLALLIARRRISALVFLTLLALPLYFTIQAYLSWASMAALLALAMVMLALRWRSGPQAKGPLIFGICSILAFVGLQHQSSQQARQAVTLDAQLRDPSSTVLDVALAAFPANPVCWTFTSIEANQQTGQYRLRRGVLSLAPQLLPISNCPPSMSELPPSARAAPMLGITWEEQGSLAQLRQLQQSNCHFDTWMRFARMPSLVGNNASDLRFVRGGSHENFTTLRLREFDDVECSPHVPQWNAPRTDLLRPAPGSPLLP